MKSIPTHIFREYDIRGTVDVDLSTDFAYILGRAYGSLAKSNEKNNIAVGHDCRLTSPSYAEALRRGIADEGIDVVDIGMCPTPHVYWVLYQEEYNFGGGIMVTGSHNPPDMNGFKICLGKVTLSGEQIQDLRSRCEQLLNAAPATIRGKESKRDLLDPYCNDLIENSKPFVGKKLKVVVDAGNGAGGITGPRVLKALGYEVIELFCEPDGHFPNHHPDPTIPENLEALIAKVKETKADLGIAWDGDADRIGAVDENGEILFGDMLLLIYGRAILETKPGATIIGDVKCSSLLFNDLQSRGGNAIMWKTGHSLIKNKLRETHGDIGGEMSGHIFFKNRFYGFDDAVYASLRLLEIVSNSSIPCSQLIADLPKMVSTPELRYDCPEEKKFQIAELAQKAFPEYKVNTTDGVRIEFPEGWGLVRASNTQSILVMRFEAQSQAKLEEYETFVKAKVTEIEKSL